MSKKFSDEEIEVFSDLIDNAFTGSEADKVSDAVHESVFHNIEQAAFHNIQRERDEANIEHFMKTGFPNVSMEHKNQAFTLAQQIKAINWGAMHRPRFFYSGLYNRLKFIVDPLA